MSRNKLIIGVVIVFSILFLILLFFVIRGGTPGGPIIVIHPEPEPDRRSVSPLTIVYKSHWRAGCPISAPPTPTPVAIDDIPSSFLTWPGADDIKVSLHSTKDPIIAGEVSFKIDGLYDVDIKHVKRGDIPAWTFKGKKLDGSSGVKDTEWPKDMIGVITELKVFDLQGRDAQVKLDDVEDISVQHNNWGLFKKCP